LGVPVYIYSYCNYIQTALFGKSCRDLPDQPPLRALTIQKISTREAAARRNADPTLARVSGHGRISLGMRRAVRALHKPPRFASAVGALSLHEHERVAPRTLNAIKNS
jgi:hypothetical protein